MPVNPPPYTDAQPIANTTDAERLKNEYLAYFQERMLQLQPGLAAWSGLGEYLLGLAQKSAEEFIAKQTRTEFAAATAEWVVKVPDWINEVVYVRDDFKAGKFVVKLPDPEIARQARLHSQNPKADYGDYPRSPIYPRYDTTVPVRDILNVKVTDYTIKHCGN
jgi:hypothetical protein